MMHQLSSGASKDLKQNIFLHKLGYFTSKRRTSHLLWGKTLIVQILSIGYLTTRCCACRPLLFEQSNAQPLSALYMSWINLVDKIICNPCGKKSKKYGNMLSDRFELSTMMISMHQVWPPLTLYREEREKREPTNNWLPHTCTMKFLSNSNRTLFLPNKQW